MEQDGFAAVMKEGNEVRVAFPCWDAKWNLRETRRGDVQDGVPAEIDLRLKWNVAVEKLMTRNYGDRNEEHLREHAGESNSGLIGPRGDFLCPGRRNGKCQWDGRDRRGGDSGVEPEGGYEEKRGEEGAVREREFACGRSEQAGFRDRGGGYGIEDE